MNHTSPRLRITGLIKFLLFLSIAISHGIFAMDLEPKKEQLSKPYLTEEQLIEDRSQLKPETYGPRAKQATEDIEMKKLYAQKIIAPIIEYIVKQSRYLKQDFTPSLKQVTPKGRIPIALRHGLRPAPLGPGLRPVTGSMYGIARIWDAATGKAIRRLKVRTCPALNPNFVKLVNVAVSPDGTKLVTGYEDGIVRIWDVNTDKELHKLKVYPSYVYNNLTLVTIAFSPDGTKLATGCDDGIARIWDVATGKELRKLKGPIDFSIYTIAFSPDGTKLATGCDDGIAYIWNVDTGKELRKLKGSTKDVYSVAFSPDGTKLATGSKNGIVRIWNVDTGKELRKLKGYLRVIRSVAFSPDGTKLVTGSMYPISKQKALVTESGDRIPIAQSRVTEYEDGIVRIWNVDTGKELRKLKGSTKDVSSVAFSPDGTKVIAGFYNGNIRIWDVDRGKVIYRIKGKGNTDSIRSVAFSPDGTKIIAGSIDKTFGIYFIAGALQWLTNNRPRKTFLLPDQAETIRKMYEAHKNNKPFTIDMQEAIRFSKMPEYVKDMLKFYLGPLKEKKEQKETPLSNIPQEEKE